MATADGLLALQDTVTAPNSRSASTASACSQSVMAAARSELSEWGRDYKSEGVREGCGVCALPPGNVGVLRRWWWWWWWWWWDACRQPCCMVARTKGSCIFHLLEQLGGEASGGWRAERGVGCVQCSHLDGCEGADPGLQASQPMLPHLEHACAHNQLLVQSQTPGMHLCGSMPLRWLRGTEHVRGS
jgi:hypothetical protein